MKKPLNSTLGQWLIIFLVAVIAVSLAASLIIFSFHAISLKKNPSLVLLSDANGSNQYFTVDGYVYLNDDLITGAHANSFKVLANGDYAIDNSSVYYNGTFLQGADSSTFVVIGDTDYAKDSGTVYYEGEKIVADPSSFILIGSDGTYAKDNSSVYYNGVAIGGADGASFKVLSDYYTLDKSHVYYDGKLIQGADPATFVLVDNSDSTTTSYDYDAKDKSNKYLEGAVVY